MATAKETLPKLLEIDGCLGACIVDSDSGMTLGSTAGSPLDLEIGKQLLRQADIRVRTGQPQGHLVLRHGELVCRAGQVELIGRIGARVPGRIAAMQHTVWIAISS